MTLREAIAAKTFQLLKNTFGVCQFISFCSHPIRQFLPELAYQTFGFKGSHTTAQLVGFGELSFDFLADTLIAAMSED